MKTHETRVTVASRGQLAHRHTKVVDWNTREEEFYFGALPASRGEVLCAY